VVDAECSFAFVNADTAFVNQIIKLQCHAFAMRFSDAEPYRTKSARQVRGVHRLLHSLINNALVHQIL
jgi:hypothetical protein